jgi:hypothetical protein
MAKPCGICKHPQLEAIERLLLKGNSRNSIAKQFGVPETNLRRHADHGVKKFSKFLKTEARTTAMSVDLLAECTERKEVLREAASNAFARAEYAAGAAIQREMTKLMEFEARLRGELHEYSTTTTNVLNLNVPDDDMKRMAERILRKGHVELPALPAAATKTIDAEVVDANSNG